MKRHLSLTLRIIFLLLFLPLLGVAFAPPIRISANCTDNNGGSIKVDSGLVSAISDSNIDALTNVNCITGSQASIQQADIKNYTDMKTLFFDQARSSFVKTTIPSTGNRVQDITDTITPEPIILSF